MDWTKRVGELHKMAHDYHETQPAMVEDYESPEQYVEAMVRCVCAGEHITDLDERRVVRNELERIVGID